MRANEEEIPSVPDTAPKAVQNRASLTGGYRQAEMMRWPADAGR